MRTKQKRPQEIAQNRRSFRLFRNSVLESFPVSDAKFIRDANLYEAEYGEINAKELEEEKSSEELFNKSQANSWDNPIKTEYRNTAVSYYKAGIYSVVLSEPESAFQCFRKCVENYNHFAELVKGQPIYEFVIRESKIVKANSIIARHEAAYRRARLLRFSFGFLGKK